MVLPSGGTPPEQYLRFVAWLAWTHASRGISHLHDMVTLTHSCVTLCVMAQVVIVGDEDYVTCTA